jgi:hypothetical protein
VAVAGSDGSEGGDYEGHAGSGEGENGAHGSAVRFASGPFVSLTAIVNELQWAISVFVIYSNCPGP